MGAIIRDLCRQKGVDLHDGHAMRDHVHSVPRSYIEDEGRPFEFSFQEQDSNHLKAASVKS